MVCAAVCACANPGSELVADDSDSRFGGLSASWEVPRSVQSDGRPPARQLLLQLEVSTSDSDDQQSLGAGESVTVDGTTFVGPSALSTGFDLHLATADARVRLRTEHAFGLDVFGGVGFARLELDANGSGAATSLEEDGFGPRVGLGLFCELPTRVRLFVEGSFQASFVGGGDIADVQTLDLGLDLRLTDSIELVLAWRRLVYELENEGADSDFDLTAAGPRLSLALRF